MTELRESCPCCAGKEIVEIGKLPDSGWFAGTRLNQPLPGGWLYRCRTCALKFRNPANTSEAYGELYDNAATTTWSVDSFRADWNLVTRYLPKTLPNGGKVLEFGCYTGGLLVQLGAQYERYGIELNRDAAAIAAQSIGRDVWSSIDEISEDLRFDAIIVVDVIEHMTDPLCLIRQLKTKLSDNGLLIITTGDADAGLWNRFGANWWYCFYPEHIVFVSEEWLHYVSKVAGLDVIDSESFGYLKLSPVRYIVDGIQTYFYGLFPATYLSLVRLLRKALGRTDPTSIPGAGLTQDHLFVVLSRAAKK